MWKRKNKSVCYIIFIIIPTIPRASPNALNKWWHSPQSWLMTYAFILQKTRKLPVDFLIPSAVTFLYQTRNSEPTGTRQYVIGYRRHRLLQQFTNIPTYSCRSLRLHNNTFPRFKFFFTFSNSRLVPHSLYSRYPVSNNFRKTSSVY